VAPGTHPDDARRFEYAALATRGTLHQLPHESFYLRHFALEGASDPGALVIVQPALCELQVELRGDPALADRVQVLDGTGKALELVESFGAFVSFGDSAQLVEGKTGVVQVLETARTLVLQKDGEEVLRKPLRLEPGKRSVESL
jgi:hypothetical protein